MGLVFAVVVIVGGGCLAPITPVGWSGWVCTDRTGLPLSWENFTGSEAEVMAACAEAENPAITMPAMAPVACPTYTVQVSWQAPDKDGDCAVLTDLSHYRVYLDGQLVADNVQTTTYVLQVGPGAHPVHVTAVDTAGNESDTSETLVRVVP